MNRIKRISLPVETGALAVFVAAMLWQIMAFPDLRNIDNFALILGNQAEVAILAVGMTLVIATGGIDISVGSVMGFCGIALGIFTLQYHLIPAVAITLTLALGAACGAFNGLLIARYKLPPIIATLAGFSAARAGAYVLYKMLQGHFQTETSHTLPQMPDAYSNFALNSYMHVPLPGWTAVFSLIVMGIILRKTRFGRTVLALGGSREASYLSGLSVLRTEIGVYVCSGLLAGLAAVMATARANPTPDAGKGLEMAAITAVVMGGTPVEGGAATMIGTALGVLSISAILKGVTSYGMGGLWVQLVLGAALLASVELDRWRRQQREKPEV